MPKRGSSNGVMACSFSLHACNGSWLNCRSDRDVGATRRLRSSQARHLGWVKTCVVFVSSVITSRETIESLSAVRPVKARYTSNPRLLAKIRTAGDESGHGGAEAGESRAA